jgi:outer membrane protein assembly factor BamB
LTGVYPVTSTRSRSIGLLFVATEDNIVQALDANTGKAVWRRSLGSPVPLSALSCGNINPLGITGTPVIDEVTQAIYVDAAIVL